MLVFFLALLPPLGSAEDLAANGTTPVAAEVLAGEWYLLVHYRETRGDFPDEVLWEDRIWRIQKRGSRLNWTNFPRVTLRDVTGRRETLPSGDQARSTGPWLPNDIQLKEIRAGLRIDPLGSRSKTLRQGAGGGWASAGELRPRGVSAVGYHERWAIEPSGSGPVFSRQDSMGSGRTDSVRALTRFRTLSVSPDGNQLRGEYMSDGDLQGEFRLIRMRESGLGGGGS